MTQIETRAFVETLDKNNVAYDLLKEMLLRPYRSFYIERKHRGMLQTSERLFRQRWPAVVDKRFGMIFGCPEGSHEPFRGVLYMYHEQEKGQEWGVEMCARFYVSEGLGYYMSSMMPGLIIAGPTYRPDRFDKDLFESYRVQCVS